MNKFDINAPIEQQYTSDGGKVTAIYHIKEVDMLIVVMSCQYYSHKRVMFRYHLDGTALKDDFLVGAPANILTKKPEIIKTSYVNVYLDRLPGAPTDTLENAINYRDKKYTALYVRRDTDNITKLESTAEIVHIY